MNGPIRLHDVGGIAKRNGEDRHGNQWTEFEVDPLAMQEPGECAICGAEITEGWLCLDGGAEVCDSHVKIMDPGDAPCPKCGAGPGEECETVDQRPVGDGRVHGERCTEAWGEV